MRQLDLTVISNEQIARDVWRIQLSTDNCQLSTDNCQLSIAPGTFVNLRIDGHYLRRPISVCDWEVAERAAGTPPLHTLTLIYKAVGQGTRRLAAYQVSECVNALAALGNGYTLVDAQRPLLLGGGVGVPPLYYLAKALVKRGQAPVAVLGFNTAAEVFYADAFAALCETVVMTADGTAGQKGFVTHAMPGLTYDALYCCGPEPMLKAVYGSAHELPAGHAQFSFERRMACGFGACMGCSCKTVTGYKRICKEGPVLTREEILWT